MLPQVRGAPVVALSAETTWGLDRLMPAVIKTHANWSTKVKTRDLNDWLALAVQRHPPPAVNGRRIKPKYVAQTKARPPTFVLFSSRANQMPEHYRRYLINSIRESFDLPGVPIRITIKSGANPYADADGDKRPMGSGFGRGAKAKPAKPGVFANAKDAKQARVKKITKARKAAKESTAATLSSAFFEGSNPPVSVSMTINRVFISPPSLSLRPLLRPPHHKLQPP
jgi:GTP-binding protein